jgi:hypothetical protein
MILYNWIIQKKILVIIQIKQIVHKKIKIKIRIKKNKCKTKSYFTIIQSRES